MTFGSRSKRRDRAQGGAGVHGWGGVNGQGVACMVGGHAWPGGMCGQGACMVGHRHGRGHAWPGGHVWLGGMHGRGQGHAWSGHVVVGGHICGREGACVARGHAWLGGMHGGHAWWEVGVCRAEDDTHTPPGRHYGYGIWSMSGPYASYLNAFLFKLLTFLPH